MTLHTPTGYSSISSVSSFYVYNNIFPLKRVLYSLKHLRWSTERTNSYTTKGSQVLIAHFLFELSIDRCNRATTVL